MEISALTGAGLDTLVERLGEIVREGKRDLWYRFGHNEQGQAAQMYRYAAVLRAEYLDDGVYLYATSDKKTQGMFAAYLCEKPEGILD